MTTRAPRHRYSYSEYVALEQGSAVRHEFFDGEIYAMAGGTPTHAGLAATVIRLVGAQLPFGCRVYSSDLRVRVPETGLSTYPDVTVVCGQTTRAVDDPLAITNPVSHREPHLLLHRRGADGVWNVVVEVKAGQTLELTAVGARLSVDDVYRDGLEDADVMR